MDTGDHGQGVAPAGGPDTGAGHVAEPRAEPPFVLIEPLRRSAPLIFASPHSGRRYPADLLANTRVGLLSLRRSEDAYVDELFAGAAAHGACVLSATVARAYLDLNRDPAELDPEMFEHRPPNALAGSARVQAGLGAIPRISGEGDLPPEAQRGRRRSAHRRNSCALPRDVGEPHGRDARGVWLRRAD